MSSPNPAEKNVSSPYVGPRPFEHNEEDRSHFFGRSQETQEIVSLIFGHPLVLVYAQSGAGKTSLFNASIIPTLEEEGFDVLPPTRVRGVMPEDVSLENIQNLYIFNALLNLEPDVDPQSLVGTSLKDFLKARPRATKEDGQPVPQAIIFDQFEELFTFSPEHWQEQREEVFQQVMDAIDADALLRVVFIIREDFLAQLDPYARSLSERLRARYRLERLQEDAALGAIKDPLASTSRSFAPDVAENLVKELLTTRTVDAAGKMIEIVGQYVEPVQLQVVCLTLWVSLPPECTVITQDHLKDFNVNIALSDFYESALRSASQETGVEEAALRDWFGKTLITPMETRSTVYRGEKTTGGIPNSAVDILESRHLIRAEYRAGVRWYELTHDRFIEAIVNSNKEWHAKKHGISGNPLTEPARDWNRLGKDEGSLLRGALLEEASAWVQSHPGELDELERAFLEASQIHYQNDLKAKARTARTFRWLTAGLAVALVIAGLAAFTASNQRNAALENQRVAQTAAADASQAEAAARASQGQAELAALEARTSEAEARSGQFAIQALTNLETDPQLSLLLAIEANNVQRTFQSEDALRQTIEASRTRAILSHQSRVNALGYSADGKYLVTGDSSGNVSLWEIATGIRMRAWEWRTGDQDDQKLSADIIAMNPGGDSFVTGSSDGFLSLWNMQLVLSPQESLPSGTPPYFRMLGLKASITSLAFSPDGELLAAGSVDGSCAIWEVGEVEPLVVLEGHIGPVTALAFSPDGDRLVTVSSDSTAKIWDIQKGLLLDTLVTPQIEGQASSINAVAYSPDGELITTVSADDSVHLWKAASGEEITVLRHLANVTSVSFDSQGRYLAAVSADNTASLWDVKTAIEKGVDSATYTLLNGHEDRINAATFSPDGALLATASADGTARLWKVPSGELQSILRGHTSSVNLVMFSPDGKSLATASSDGTVRLWDTTSEQMQKTLRGHKSWIWDVAINSQGNLLASKGEDATILWDFNKILTSETNDLTGTVIDGPGIGFGPAFSSDGKLLATSSFDEDTRSGLVRIWNLSQSTEDAVTSHDFHDEIVLNFSFRPTEELLAVSTSNENRAFGKLYLWSISKSPSEDIILSNFGAEIAWGLTFNSEGSLLAASSVGNLDQTGSIHLWNVDDLITGGDNSEVAVLRGQGGPVLVAFSPDGKTLASGGFDGTVRLWDVATAISNGGDEAEIAVLNGHEGYVAGLTFSADGRWLASSDEKGNIRIWDLSKAVKTGGRNAEVSILRGQGEEVYGVAFSPNQDWLVSAGADELIRLWPLNIEYLISLACSRATRNLTQSEWDTYFGRDEEYRLTCNNLPYHPSALEAMIEKGKNLARQGQEKEAIAIWNRVDELPTVPEFKSVDPDELLAEILVEKGQEYASAGDADKAVETLRRAKELDPTLDIKPEEDVAEALAEAGQQYAYSGDFDKALETLRRAKELDPTLELEPESIVAERLLENVRYDAETGNIDLALDNLARAVELDPKVETTQPHNLVRAYYSICWFGSLDKVHVQSVVPTCQQAVELAVKSDFPDIGIVWDGRGLSHTMNGDFAGAIEDFTFYVQWAKDNKDFEEKISQREQWISLLEQGRNPFEEDPDLLEELRQELPYLPSELPATEPPPP